MFRISKTAITSIICNLSYFLLKLIFKNIINNLEERWVNAKDAFQIRIHGCSSSIWFVPGLSKQDTVQVGNLFTDKVPEPSWVMQQVCLLKRTVCDTNTGHYTHTYTHSLSDKGFSPSASNIVTFYRCMRNKSMATISESWCSGHQVLDRPACGSDLSVQLKRVLRRTTLKLWKADQE